jgi:hypothetical protein
LLDIGTILGNLFIHCGWLPAFLSKSGLSTIPQLRFHTPRYCGQPASMFLARHHGQTKGPLIHNCPQGLELLPVASILQLKARQLLRDLRTFPKEAQ